VPTVSPSRLAFVTQVEHVAAELVVMDTHCQDEAVAAGLDAGGTKTFKALLSTLTASAASRFNGSGAAWVRVDGVSLAPTAAEFLAQGATAPLNVSSTGEYVRGRVWTGSTAIDVQTAGDDDNCIDWQDPNGFAKVGDATITSRMFTDDQASSQLCSTPARIYCLEE